MYKILFIIFFPLCLVAAEKELEEEWHIVEDGPPVVTMHPNEGYEGYMISRKGIVSDHKLKLEWVTRRAVLVALMQTSLATQHVYMNAYNLPKGQVNISPDQSDQYKNFVAWVGQLQDIDLALQKKLFLFMPSCISSSRGDWRTKIDWRAKSWAETLGRVVGVKEPVVVPYAISSHEVEQVCKDGIDHLVIESSLDGAIIRCQQSKDLSVENKWEQRIPFLGDIIEK